MFSACTAKPVPDIVILDNILSQCITPLGGKNAEGVQLKNWL